MKVVEVKESDFFLEFWKNSDGTRYDGIATLVRGNYTLIVKVKSSTKLVNSKISKLHLQKT